MLSLFSVVHATKGWLKEKYAQDGEHDEELHTHHDDKRRTQRVLGEKSSDAIKSLLHESQK